MGDKMPDRIVAINDRVGRGKIWKNDLTLKDATMSKKGDDADFYIRADLADELVGAAQELLKDYEGEREDWIDEAYENTLPLVNKMQAALDKYKHLQEGERMLKKSDFEKIGGPLDFGCCDLCLERGLGFDECGVTIYRTIDPVKVFASSIYNRRVYFCKECYEQCED